MWNHLLKNIAKKASARGKLPEASPELLQEIWPALVGEQLARISSPHRLVDSTLTIGVRHETLLREWQRRPKHLLGKIQELSPWPVSALEICLDPSAGDTVASKKTPPNKKQAAPLAPLPPAEGIDNELGAILGSIARHRRDRED